MLSVEIRPRRRTPAGWCAGSGDTEAVRSVRHGPKVAPGPMVVGRLARPSARSAAGTLRAVTADPLLDPVPPTHDVAPTPGLWRNGAFLRVWSGGHDLRVRQLRDPHRAAVRGDPDAQRRARSRSPSCAASTSSPRCVVGFVAGAWVDRLRRRPGADLGGPRAGGPAGHHPGRGDRRLADAAAGVHRVGARRRAHDLLRRRRPRLPADRRRPRRTSCGPTAPSRRPARRVEFAAFGVAGFLVNLLTAPIAIAIDAVSFVVSAVLLGSIRRPEPPPPPAPTASPSLHEIREGLRLVVHDPVLRGLAWGTMGLAAMWGVFGATWLLFVTDELQPRPGGDRRRRGARRASGRCSGALLAERAAARFGLGRVVVVSLLFAALGNLLIPLAPAGAAARRDRLPLGQQLIGDTAVTVFDVTEISVRQARVGDRQLGRVNATVRVAMVLAQLAGDAARRAAGRGRSACAARRSSRRSSRCSGPGRCSARRSGGCDASSAPTSGRCRVAREGLLAGSSGQSAGFVTSAHTVQTVSIPSPICSAPPLSRYRRRTLDTS